MPFVLLHFHKEKGPAGTLHRFSSGSLPQSGGAVLPPVSGENCRSPIFSADSSNRTVRDNTAAGPPETFVPRFSAGHTSCGEGPDCHRSGQSPVPVSPPLLLGKGCRVGRSGRSHRRWLRSRNSRNIPCSASCWDFCHRERDSRPYHFV